MSELEQSATGSSLDSSRPPRNEDLVDALGDPPAAEREGLPRGYRMRADSHYVEQLESRYACPAIRLIPARQIETIEPSSSVRVEALARSIAAHGIVQPLLVRTHNGRYQLIAGRKRLAAAIEAGVTDVPCLIHDVDEAEAAALAEADNLRTQVAPDQGQSSTSDEFLHHVLRTLSTDLAGIGTLAALLRPTPTSAFRHRATADLIQAQAWRAAWLAGATAIVTGQHGPSRPKPIESILDCVKAGFEAEARLTSLQLECAVAPNAAGFAFDEDLGVAAVTGSVFATLSWLEACEEPRVEVRAAAPNPRTLNIEVAQRTASIPPELARYLREPGSVRPGDLTAALGLAAVKSLAEQHGGTSELIAIGGRGSVIRSTFCRSAAN